MAAVRVDQSAVEMIVFTNPPVRVDQSCVEFIVAPQAPTINCGNPPTGAVAVPYAHVFPVTGGLAPFVFVVTVPAIPSGLVLDASTGVLGGIPTAPGLFAFSLRVTDANLQSSTVSCTVQIAGGPVKITLRGINRRRSCGESVKITDVPSAPSVGRAI